jgi:hypothetical protein
MYLLAVLVAATIAPQIYCAKAYARMQPYRRDRGGDAPEPMWKSLSSQLDKVRPSTYSPDGQGQLRTLWFWVAICHLAFLLDAVVIFMR